jgi:formamidopyrimidine-DNA glycosylase
VPELPEVETVRAGLHRWVLGRAISEVEVLHPRSVRRHLGGSTDFTGRLTGMVIAAVQRRGKYLWLPLQQPDVSQRVGDQAPDVALIAHLGMSGQLLVQSRDIVDSKHLRVRFRFADGGDELRFVDQRTFGGLILDDLVATTDEPGGAVPALVAHIARDPLDPLFDEAAWIARVRRASSGIKRLLLDQTVISGVGNIYADESLWRAKLHGRRSGSALRPAALLNLLGHVRAVLNEALAQGGTSFDALYVNVNGESGYFDRSLAVYGREGEPCPRCATPIRREAFMNRSSFYCPKCQPPPRVGV